MKLSNAPGDRPEVFGKVGVCWRRSCDEAFRRYWRLRLKAVLPRFEDLNGMVIEIGETNGCPHVVHKNADVERAVLRLNPPPSVLEERPQDFYVLAHELSHWIHDEQYTDLFAMAHAPRTRDIGYQAPFTGGYYPEARKAIRDGLEDAVADLAAMALQQHGNRQLWFSSQVNELVMEAELVVTKPATGASE